MGHITNLIINTEHEETWAFEAKNTAPFFWIGLLDSTTLTTAKPAWDEYHELITRDDENEIERYTDILPAPTNIIIEREVFRTNAIRTQKYLEKFYPEAVQLFVDFKQYLESKLTQPDDNISIDFIELVHFTSVDDFYQSLMREIERLDKQANANSNFFMSEDLIGFGIGFANDEFIEQSETYYRLAQNKRRVPHYPKHKSEPKFSDSYKHFASILLIAPLFTYAAYRGYLDEGLSFMVIALALSNLGFYCYSIFRLIEIFRAPKDK